MPIDISKFDKCKILVVGDFMIDEYVWGDVERISPEAPVQIVSVNKEDYRPGGAGNVVNNLISLGAKVFAVGTIGTGRNGKLLLEKLNELDVDTKGVIRDSDRPTTRKTRIIAANQHVLRIDRETRKEISNRTFQAVIKILKNKILSVDVILISDYGKGLVTASLLSKLTETAKKHQKITIADPKGLDFSKYSGVSLLTPNKKEAGLAAGIDIEDELKLLEAGKKITNKTGIERLLITCGKEGMVLFEHNRKPYKIKAEAKQIFDVSGAGDTVLAVIGLGMASGASYKDSAELANIAAGIVVGKVGTATVSSEELAKALKP